MVGFLNRVAPEVERQAKPAPTSLLQRAAPALDVVAAMKEITRAPAAAIHRAAAFSWGARAIAGYRICASEPRIEDALHYYYLGEHYRETALVHAMLGEDWERLHAEMEGALEPDRAAALEAVGLNRGPAPRPRPRRRRQV